MSGQESRSAQPSNPYQEATKYLAQLLQQDPYFSPQVELLYERLDLIGEGGMGRVIRVYDHRLKRYAALKTLSVVNPNPTELARFFREAQITAGLDHPAIPAVYEAGRDSKGQFFILMRMIDGQTLSKLIKTAHKKSKKGDRRGLIEILGKVAEVVAYAHDRGIVHRDLKPDNIMVGRFGEVMVMDWGIARNLTKEDNSLRDTDLARDISELGTVQPNMTVPGKVLGTPGYMSPEQADGCPVDTRADVFALGSILTEIFTGEPAIAGDTALLRVMQTLGGVIYSPNANGKLAPPELDALATVALEFEAENRLESAELFAQDLQCFLRGEASTVYRYGVSEKMKRGIARRPGLFLGAIACLGALTVAGLGFSELSRARTERAQALSENRYEKIQKEFAVAQRKEAELVARQAELQEKQALREAKRADELLQFINKGQSLARRGARAEELEATIEKALRLGERSYSVLIASAEIYLKGNYTDRAKLLLDEASRNEPSIEALFLLHKISLKFSSKEIFFSSYLDRIVKQSKRHNIENEFSLFAIAAQLASEGKYHAAIRVMEKCEKYSTRFLFGINNRGWLHLKLGDYKEARELFNRAIAIDPLFAVAYNNRGFLNRLQKQYGESLRDMNRALEFDPGNALFYHNRANVYLSSGKMNECLSDLNKALEIAPDQAEFLLSRGDYYRRQRQLEKAMADVEKALALNPKLAQGYEDRAQLWLLQRQIVKAEADVNRALTLQPKMLTALLLRLRIVSQLRKFQIMEQDLERIFKIDSQNSEAAMAYVWLQRKNGRIDKGIAKLEAILRENPNHKDRQVLQKTLRTLKR
ncbi:MAG: tetratricopeptide repeat protein [Planctomycetota bacterium]|nr:tetratricopeptide repeat protein [Planctomycetota bacterium]